MRFSIRGIFAATMLIALVVGAWINRRTAIREAIALQMRQSELVNLQTTLKAQGDLSKQRDKFRSIARIEDRAMKHFEEMRERYSIIDPVGPGVLAMRSLVELPIDGGHAPDSFRMLIPEERPIWLRCSVLSIEDKDWRPKINEPHSVIDSAFSTAEPFAYQLEPGERILRILSRPVQDKMLPIEIEIDGKVVLKTSYHFEESGHSGLSHISAPIQYNIEPNGELPHLITFRMFHENADGRETGEGPYVLSIWLSEHP